MSAASRTGSGQAGCQSGCDAERAGVSLVERTRRMQVEPLVAGHSHIASACSPPRLSFAEPRLARARRGCATRRLESRRRPTSSRIWRRRQTRWHPSPRRARHHRRQGRPAQRFRRSAAHHRLRPFRPWMRYIAPRPSAPMSGRTKLRGLKAPPRRDHPRISLPGRVAPTGESRWLARVGWVTCGLVNLISRVVALRALGPLSGELIPAPCVEAGQ